MLSTHDYLNRAWKATCKAIFSQEIGELDEFSEYLSAYAGKRFVESSTVSGKKVIMPSESFKHGANFLGSDEVDFSKSFTPLSINEIKDIDSIISAMQERIHYTGNIVLGNSKFVEESSNVVDSHYVLGSTIVSDSKYIAFCTMIRFCEYMFGSTADAQSSFTINSVDNHKGKRCFECCTLMASSDCYYSVQCKNCRECMFSFGPRNKSYLIGNLEVGKEKYLAVKSKLLEEIVGSLKKEKKVFSIFEILDFAREKKPEIKIAIPPEPEKGNLKPIEESFTKTSSILVAKPLAGIKQYEKFLQRDVLQGMQFTSPFTGRKVLLGGYLAYIGKKFKLNGRFVSEDEINEIGKVPLSKLDTGKIIPDPKELAEIFHPVAYCSLDDRIGKVHNMIDCFAMGYSENCYRCEATVHSKKCAYSFWPRESENIFGSSSVWQSSFCMKAFRSKRLVRCFEVDNCEECTDLYFSHNCENVHDSMFCFNTKNKRNAIGNAEIPKDDYKKAKQSVLDQLGQELEKKKTIKWDIYSLAKR